LTCMCMHIIFVSMRTTIEITDEQRSRLLAIAGERGMKGFSSIVREALEEYLSREEERAKRVSEALSVMGSLKDEEAAEMEKVRKDARRKWR